MTITNREPWMEMSLTEIRRDPERKGYYFVDMVIDGQAHTFLFSMSTLLPNAVTHRGGGYDRATKRWPAANCITRLICDFHEGKHIDFPIDMNEYALEVFRKSREMRERERQEWEGEGSNREPTED